ncbi:hypothetical protein GCM10008964_20800 [Methylophaga marina]|uniref:Uncharacterized protein n=1 Tax=Methylophaga marina TaxID=45495 RepID=A0ABN0TSQ2_9GAMM
MLYKIREFADLFSHVNVYCHRQQTKNNNGEFKYAEESRDCHAAVMAPNHFCQYY